MAGAIFGPEVIDLSGPGLSLLPEFRWRVLTPWGALVSNDLPHLSSRYTVNGILRGVWPPTATIGTASIDLIPPRAWNSAAVKALWLQDFAAVYAQMDEMLRVECYERFSSSPNPVWTGLITKRPKKTSAYALDASDSLMLLQKAKTDRNDYYVDTAFVIASAAMKDWVPWYADDFSDPGFKQRYPINTTIAGERMDYLPSPTAYNVDGGGSWVHASVGGRGYVYVSSSGTGFFCASPVVPSTPQKLDAKFSITCWAGAGPCQVGLVFGRDDAATKHWRAVITIDPSPGVGNPCEITVSLLYNGFGLMDSRSVKVFPDVKFFGAKIAADSTVVTDVQLGVWVNDKGVRVTWNGSPIAGGDVILDGSAAVSGLHVADTIGQVGLFYSASAQVYIRDLYAFTLVPQFTLTMAPTTRIYEHDFNQTSRLEQLLIAAFSEDLDLYKEPRPGMDEIWTGVPAGLGDALPPTVLDDFEGSLSGWIASGGSWYDHATNTYDSPVPPTTSTLQAHSGTHSLALVHPLTTDPADSAGSWIYRDIVVPPGAGSLSLWRWSSSRNPLLYASDAGAYLIDLLHTPDSNGYFGGPSHVLATFFDFYNFTYAPPADERTWVRHTVDLTPWAGRTVRLMLIADCYGDLSQTFVDDIELSGQTSLPEFTVAKYDAYGNLTDPGNVLDNTAAEDPNTNKFATEVAVTGQGAGGGGPIITARNLDAIRKYGMWNLQQSLVDIRDVATQIKAADITVDVASSPEQARSLTVWDRPGRTKGKWREQSVALLNVPDLGDDMTNAQRIIVGYDRVENSDLRTLRLDNFSSRMALPEMARIRSELDNLMGLSMQYLPPIPGVVSYVIDQNGLPVVFNGDGVRTFQIDPSTGVLQIGDGLAPPTSAGTGGGINLVGTGTISLPVDPVIPAGGNIILSQVPFTVTDHPCWIWTLALFSVLSIGTTGDTVNYVNVELRIGATTGDASLVSNTDFFAVAEGLQKCTLIAPNSSPLAAGDWIAYIVATNTGTDPITLTRVDGQFQVYCA